jgi:hypothetical protein
MPALPDAMAIRREAGEEAPIVSKLVRGLRHKQRLYLRLDFDIDTPTTYRPESEEGARTYPHIVVPIHLVHPRRAAAPKP